MLAVEADTLAGVVLPRLLLEIGYTKNEMNSQPGYISCENKNSNRSLKAIIYPSNALEKDQLDLWLTERHALYIFKRKKMYRIDIHHRPWRLRQARITTVRQNYTEGLAAPIPVRQHYAKNLKVLAWTGKPLG